jgi:hypothetical protein
MFETDFLELGKKHPFNKELNIKVLRELCAESRQRIWKSQPDHIFIINGIETKKPEKQSKNVVASSSTTNSNSQSSHSSSSSSQISQNNQLKTQHQTTLQSQNCQQINQSRQIIVQVTGDHAPLPQTSLQMQQSNHNNQSISHLQQQIQHNHSHSNLPSFGTIATFNYDNNANNNVQTQHYDPSNPMFNRNVMQTNSNYSTNFYDEDEHTSHFD